MTPDVSPTGRLLTLFALILTFAGSTGCAALTNPVADGIPVRRLPPDVLGESREAFQPVPLTKLTPRPATDYRLGAGDVLGVFIEGVLGEQNGQPPVRISEQGNVPPSIGFPIPVRDNGTLPLPLIDAVNIKGLTLDEAQAKIIQAYLEPRKILKLDEKTNQVTNRVIVTLVKPRQYHVLVLREDAGGVTFGSSGGSAAIVGGGTSVSVTRRAAGFPLDLPAGENDLLNALTRSGGLPGVEAEDEVIIERGAYRPVTGAAVDAVSPTAYEGRGKQTIRIPLRQRVGQPVAIPPENLILQSGDVILVRARQNGLFFTGGLLPPRAFPLPQDRDLDVIEAISVVGGPLVNGGFNANNLNGQLLQSGLGFPSPSQVTVVRRTKSGMQIPILVNLNRALKDPRERLLIQPNDVIVLQQTAGEGVAQYLTTNFRLNFFSTILRAGDLTGTGSFTAP